MKKILLASVVCLAASGCASIFSGTTSDIAIRTTAGAKYTVTNTYGKQVASGTVGDDESAKANLTRGASYFSPHAYKMHISKPGYRPATIDIQPGMNGWYFGNILIGGFIGMVIVDPLTGAMWRMVPTTDNVMLEPTGEDISAINRQSEIVKNAQSFKVSKNEYSASRVSMAQGCQHIATPESTKTNTGESLVFECKDGRSVKVTCSAYGECK